MENQITVKRSPLVLIRLFLLIEIAAIALFSIATQLDNLKYQLYSSVQLSNLISYQMMKFPFLSVIQFLITVYVFLRWYNEKYTLQRKILCHEKGVVLKRKKSFALNESVKISPRSGFFGKLLKYGSVFLKNQLTAENFIIADIQKPREFIRILEESIRQKKVFFENKPNIAELIALGEHERLEFKSSLRFDHKTNQVNRELEKMTMKTIAAFLNSEGGHLVIGLNDKKEPIGLFKDYETLRKPDKDGFENHFTQVFNTMIGPAFRSFVKIWFDPITNIEVCIVMVLPSPKPVYLKFNDEEYFYVRTGNATTPLKLSEIETYGRSRWPERNRTKTFS